MLLCIRDETASGQSLHEISIDFLTEQITVRELIRERVHHEVKEFNRRQGELVFNGLVQPEQAELVLNGNRPAYRFKHHQPVDWEVQVERALDGFASNSFFVLIDDKQAGGLDETFSIGPDTRISFIKLVPLVGG